MEGRFKELIDTKTGGISQIMAVLGLFLGTTILLIGVQWLFDLQQINNGGKANGPFITLNKPISLLNSIGGPSLFDDAEIAEIKAYPEVDEVAAFRSNDFKLRAGVPQLGFYSELFFESVSEKMLPDLPSVFKWYPGDNLVPILIPKDYIALYNFGFAPSQGLPQVSPSLIERFSFNLEISGSAGKGRHKGKIVGFSEQINTILVPDDFLAWANQRYAGKSEITPTRLAVRSHTGSLSNLKDKLDRAGYELGGYKLINERTSRLLSLAFFGIVGIGIMIFLLAVYVAYQYRQLLFESHRANLERLFEFGQDPKLVLDYFNSRFSLIIFTGLGAGIIFYLLLNYLLKSWLNAQGFDLNTTPHILTLLIGLLLLTLLILNQKKQLRQFLKSCY